MIAESWQEYLAPVGFESGLQPKQNRDSVVPTAIRVKYNDPIDHQQLSAIRGPFALSTSPSPCGLPRRLAAMLYDSLLVTAILMLSTVLVIIPLGREVPAGSLAFQFYLLVVAWAYFAISWRAGQTLGMKAWRIRIVAGDQPPGWLATAVRFGVSLASIGCLGLGLLWSLFRSDRATWHDLASDTRLLVLPKLGPAQQ